MICTLDSLMEDVFYDWGMTPSPQIHPFSTNTPTEWGFYINKTYVFCRNGQYFLNYKTDEAPIEEETFNEFVRLARAYATNPQIYQDLEDYGARWGDKDFPHTEFKKFLLKFK